MAMSTPLLAQAEALLASFSQLQSKYQNIQTSNRSTESHNDTVPSTLQATSAHSSEFEWLSEHKGIVDALSPPRRTWQTDNQPTTIPMVEVDVDDELTHSQASLDGVGLSLQQHTELQSHRYSHRDDDSDISSNATYDLDHTHWTPPKGYNAVVHTTPSKAAARDDHEYHAPAHQAQTEQLTKPRQPSPPPPKPSLIPVPTPARTDWRSELTLPLSTSWNTSASLSTVERDSERMPSMHATPAKASPPRRQPSAFALQHAATVLSKVGRGFLARQRTQHRQQHRQAAIMIQKHW